MAADLDESASELEELEEEDGGGKEEGASRYLRNPLASFFPFDPYLVCMYVCMHAWWKEVSTLTWYECSMHGGRKDRRKREDTENRPNREFQSTERTNE